MTTIIILVLITANYMLIHWLYGTANELHKKGKKQLVRDTVQAGIAVRDLEESLDFE